MDNNLLEEERKRNEIAMENRFGYFRELDDDQLEQALENLKKELGDWEEIYTSDNAISEAKSDAWTEIKFNEEKISFVKKVLAERNKGKTR